MRNQINLRSAELQEIVTCRFFLDELKKLPDSELVNLYRGGNEKCLEVLIERVQSPLFAFILNRVGDNDLANDVFQETFYKAICSLKADKYREEDKFLQWIMRIARNMIIDCFRVRQRRRMISSVKNSDGERESIFNVMDFENKTDFFYFEKKEDRKRMRQLIKLLPPKQREILIMREYFDMSFKEIESVGKININTALGTMRIALINLKKLAKKEKLKTG